MDSMRLKWLPVNCAYAFTWHGQLIRLDNAPMFYATRSEAAREAARVKAGDKDAMAAKL